ncbi:uracil-DNA glycosylase family protein [Thermodesulfobacteriota bacterium]
MPEEENWIQLAKAYLEYRIRIGAGEVLFPADVPAPGVSGEPEARFPAEVPASGESVEPEVSRSLDAVRKELGDCTRCGLSEKRKNIVFGEGNPEARLMFVGEGPGRDEDLQGRPFVGRAGQLLTKMIRAMGFERDEVYIANVVKCRPPGNRDPQGDEISTCLPFLEAQINSVKPEVIVALGRVATNTLLQSNAPLSRQRGRFHETRGILVMPTYHPSFLLRHENNEVENRKWKGEAWADLKMVMAHLGSPVPHSGVKS